MTRRPDPRQPSFLDVLAQPQAAPAAPAGVETDWSARLIALVAEGLPPGVPAPFTEVLSARPDPNCETRMWGEVRMFDGLVHGIVVLRSHGHRVYGFSYPRTDTAPQIGYWAAYPAFAWDPAAGAWLRGEPSRNYEASAWSAHLGRPGFEGYLVGPPVDACRPVAA